MCLPHICQWPAKHFMRFTSRNLAHCYLLVVDDCAFAAAVGTNNGYSAAADDGDDGDVDEYVARKASDCDGYV
uniref:Uncharacterized protein n=1 Tax=Glossina brevipalpis TaxID=37001 RepID=A0A1A9W6R9_9MUSC